MSGIKGLKLVLIFKNILPCNPPPPIRATIHKQVEVLFPIAETIVKSINKYSKLRPSLSLCLFYEPRLQYIANQSGSGKETVEMLVCFICLGTQDRFLIDINHHYQITMNQHKNWTWKLNINIYTKVTFLLYQLLVFLNRFAIYLFRQRDCKEKFLLAGGSWLLFISPGRWIGNKQLF